MSRAGRRVRNRELRRLHRGAYLVGHRALAPLAQEWAAVLACGTRAVVSHVSAAAAWQLLEAPGSVDITVVGRQVRPREGISIHRTGHMPDHDLRRLNGLPVTAPVRTVLDLAAIAHPQLERALSEAHAKRLIRPVRCGR